MRLALGPPFALCFALSLALPALTLRLVGATSTLVPSGLLFGPPLCAPGLVAAASIITGAALVAAALAARLVLGARALVTITVAIVITITAAVASPVTVTVPRMRLGAIAFTADRRQGLGVRRTLVAKEPVP